MSRTFKLISVILLASSFAWAEKWIASGSKIYVEAEKGFDVYLTAALDKKKVPLTVVSDRDKADYIIQGMSSQDEKGWASKIFLGHRDTTEATIKVIDAKSAEVVYAYAVHKKNSARGHQSTAEACAKHLRKIVH